MPHALWNWFGKLERRARIVAVGITAVIVAGTLSVPIAKAVAGYYIEHSGVGDPDLVLKPGYEVPIDGQKVAIRGFDDCPQDPRASKVFWIGGRPPALLPVNGCVVVTPDTKQVQVRLGGNRTEIWTVEHQQIDGSVATSLRRPNGQYVTRAG